MSNTKRATCEVTMTVTGKMLTPVIMFKGTQELNHMNFPYIIVQVCMLAKKWHKWMNA